MDRLLLATEGSSEKGNRPTAFLQVSLMFLIVMEPGTELVEISPEITYI
ncbi:MAG: hypothetical protein ABIH26_08285 [Candidatus Eisenbacteria bacterium]